MRRKKAKEKIYLILLVIVLFLLPTISFASSQNEKGVTLNLEAVTVKEFFDALREQTGLSFVYNTEQTALLKPISIRVNDGNVDEVLNKVFKNSGFTYTVEKNIVTILQEQNAPDKNVRGVVTDDKGKPITGASIVLKGTQNGAITDINGAFHLSYSSKVKNPQLVVSFLGMATQEVEILDQTNLTIKLLPETSHLDEVVVIGYGTAKAKDLTGSVSRLSSKEIELAPMASGLSSLLQGRASGVNVMISSASPTSAVSVVIRGISSLSGDGQPLWIIDGIPQYSSGISGDVSNTLYNLNLNDVQSIDILKDASATAIYGSRAANGVVIVTTKTGVEGMKPTIEFSTRWGWQVLNSNDFKTMDAEQYKYLSKKANLLEAFRLGSISYFNRRFMDSEKFAQINTSQWDMTDIDDMWLPNAYYDGTDNYWDLMTQNALSQDYNLSLRGGSASNSYFASINYKDQDGVVKGGDSRYIGARFNFESRISNTLKFGLNMDVSSRQVNQKDNMLEQIIKMRPDYPAYNEDGTINRIDTYTKNPLIELEDKKESVSRNFSGSFFLEYDIFSFLKLRSTLNTTYINRRSEDFFRRYYEGSVNRGWHRANEDYVIVWDNLLTYYKTIGKHDIQALLGHSMEKQSTNFLLAEGADFPDDDVLTNLGSAATKDKIDSNKYGSTLASGFARIQYKFNNRYLLTGTFRADGSSRFGKDSRWGYFPSVALAWILTEESFMKPLKPYVSYLKLRGSYGLTGSQNLSYYDYISYMGSNVYNSSPGVYPTSIGNNALQWESQAQTDIALDYGFFDDRVRGTLGWYRKYVDNLISDRPIPLSSAFNNTKQNIGAISNTGIEFDVTVELMRTKDLTWEFNLNAAHNKGKLKKLNGVTTFLGGRASDNYKLEEGGELGRFYGYVDAGRFFENNEEVWALRPIDQATGRPTNGYRAKSFGEGEGDVYVVDLDGDGVITADGDRKYLGSSNPDVFGGFGSTLYWKGLMFNLTFSYSIGGKRLWHTEAQKFGGLNAYNAPDLVLDSWTVKGKDAKYPVTTHYGVGENSVFTNRWLHDASYLRLSALNISYRLPQNWFANTLIKGVEATFQATNLFTITKYPGMDPQGNFTVSPNMALYGLGTDYSSYPAARMFNFGLKFTIN